MGNRAVITTPEKKVGLYLHWNGGRDTVEPLLKYCELQGYRPPSSDCYGWARMAQVVGNFFGGTLSLGIDRFDALGDQGDNGVYVIDGWKIVDHYTTEYDKDFNRTGTRHFDPACEQHEHGFDEMLRDFDASMPKALQLGEFLDSIEVPVDEVKLGDEVWLHGYEETWQAFPVVGFGQPDCSRIAVFIERPDGRTDVTYPDRPYVACYGRDGDFSQNPNNYVHGDTARIKPRK